jgi:hypothetical protein
VTLPSGSRLETFEMSPLRSGTQMPECVFERPCFWFSKISKRNFCECVVKEYSVKILFAMTNQARYDLLRDVKENSKLVSWIGSKIDSEFQI